jgi:cobalt-precorrin 5A hydrolase
VPVHTISGPAVVVAGPGVSVMFRKGEYTVGIGCRKGIKKDEVLDAVRHALVARGIAPDNVFVYATTAKKMSEKGLRDAVPNLSAGLVFLDDGTINEQAVCSPSKAGRIGLAGVAEPCALALSKRKELVMPKTVYGKVTVAIAR